MAKRTTRKVKSSKSPGRGAAATNIGALMLRAMSRGRTRDAVSRAFGRDEEVGKRTGLRRTKRGSRPFDR